MSNEKGPRIPFVDELNNFKVFNDPIHGHIEFHPLCIAIIDTPQFQRLRYLRQMGACYYVFPGATSNRFEHSLGVAHLAGQLVMTLQSRQSELKITEVDILCVIVAGLCHDLGHGPFSHMFDGKFIPAARPGYDWRHEDASVQMFDYLVKENNLVPEFEKYGLMEQDRIFIKEQIAGPQSRRKENPDGKKEWRYVGRGEDKSYLYEIVANKRNGIDVDKWDYFARDCYVLGIKNNFDHQRFMKFVRVIKVDGEMQICSRDKEAGTVYDMFHTRAVLHKSVYQHKVKDIVEVMITEAFLEADPYLRVSGTDGRMLKISETIDDMCAYSKMNDSLYFRILHSDQPELAKARAILERIERRKIYKCVGESQPKPGRSLGQADSQTIAEQILAYIPDVPNVPDINTSDLIIQFVNLDYGMKTANPLDYVRFYMKRNPHIPIRVRKDQVSQMLPDTFSEQLVRVYVKSQDENVEALVRDSFKEWCAAMSMYKPKDGDAFDMTLSQADSTTCSQKDILNSPPRDFDTPIKPPRVSSTPIRHTSEEERRGSVETEPNSSIDISQEISH